MISVIIPIYNTERYLKKCIESVINQTYQNLEILLVDDGSTDSSALICDEYAEKDNRILVWHRKNCGVSAGRNYALARSKGEWISFVDSDDWLRLDMYQTMMDLAEQTSANMVCCGAYQGDDEAVTERKIWRRFEGTEIVYQRKDALAQVIEQSGTLWNKLLDGESARRILFHTNIRYAEDTLYLAEYLEQNKKVAVTKECLYYYRVNREGNVVSAGLNDRHLDYICATGILFDLLQKNGLAEIGVERVVDVIVRILALVANPRIEIRYIKEVKNLAQKAYPFRKTIWRNRSGIKQLVKYWMLVLAANHDIGARTLAKIFIICK